MGDKHKGAKDKCDEAHAKLKAAKEKLEVSLEKLENLNNSCDDKLTKEKDAHAAKEVQAAKFKRTQTNKISNLKADIAYAVKKAKLLKNKNIKTLFKNCQKDLAKLKKKGDGGCSKKLRACKKDNKSCEKDVKACKTRNRGLKKDSMNWLKRFNRCTIKQKTCVKAKANKAKDSEKKDTTKLDEELKTMCAN